MNRRLGGSDAALRIPLPRLQQKILVGSDAYGARQEQGQVPEVQEHEGRTAMGSVLRHDFEEELVL